MMVNGTKDPSLDTPNVPFTMVKTEAMSVQRKKGRYEKYFGGHSVFRIARRICLEIRAPPVHRRGEESKATIMDTMIYASFAVISGNVARDNERLRVQEPEFTRFDMTYIRRY